MIRNILSFAKGILTGDRDICRKADAFMHTPRFILPVMVLSALGNLFALELPVYGLFTALVVWVCLLGSDLLPLMPIAAVCYLIPSRINNPGRDGSVLFSLSGGGIPLILMATVMAVALGCRIWRERDRIRKLEFRLLPGMVALSASYFLGGLFSPSWPQHLLSHWLFCLIQSACLMLPYLLFSVAVDWKKVRRDWFGWIGFGMGCLLLLETLWIYLTQSVIVDGMIIRKEIYTGWGMYNNLGGMMLIMLPFPFYLGNRYEKETLGLLGGTVFWLGVLLSSSRNAILLGTALYGFCVLRTLILRADRKKLMKIGAFVALGILALIVLLWKPLSHLYKGILDQGLDMSSRDGIYTEGLAFFEQYPIFGVSFFSPGYQPWSWSTNDGFTNFFPGRWHNTFIQLLATGGLVSLLAYCYHRYQTARLFLGSRRPEIFYICAALVAFLASSFFDCHFFNVGPTLFYSIALAFAERIVKSQVPLRKR